MTVLIYNLGVNRIKNFITGDIIGRYAVML